MTDVQKLLFCHILHKCIAAQGGLEFSKQIKFVRTGNSLLLKLLPPGMSYHQILKVTLRSSLHLKSFLMLLLRHTQRKAAGLPLFLRYGSACQLVV
ncbi:hypothetical protein D3C80_1271970 [compost metagenome]